MTLLTSPKNWCRQEKSKWCCTMGSSKQGVQRAGHYHTFEWFFHLPLAEGSSCHAELLQRPGEGHYPCCHLSHTGERALHATARNRNSALFAEYFAIIGPCWKSSLCTRSTWYAHSATSKEPGFNMWCPKLRCLGCPAKTQPWCWEALSPEPSMPACTVFFD